jgi:hypothetical protein
MDRPAEPAPGVRVTGAAIATTETSCSPPGTAFTSLKLEKALQTVSRIDDVMLPSDLP